MRRTTTSWPRRRKRSTRRTISSCPGRRRRCPERERTKHVHRLHPYLGKFIPQLVETLLDRHVPAGGRVLDPFAGSGTTLVQALESGYDATGVDIAGFNALLVRVKTRPYNLDALRRDLLWAHAEAEAFEPKGRYPREASAYVRAWYAPTAAEELLHFRSLDRPGRARPTCCASCSHARPARPGARPISTSSSRASRSSSPTGASSTGASAGRSRRARRFLLRYTLDTLDRIETFAAARADGRIARMLHGDARAIDLEGPYDGVVTSPPYPGLIDYHEQHRYAYELLGVDERRDLELGRPARGTGRAAIEEYVDGVADGARERPLVARARRTDVHRRQRPPRSLPGDPRSAPGCGSSTATSGT